MIERIKQEIEQRISDNTFGAKLELIDLLSFIESLEEEPKCKTNPLFEDCLAKVNPDVRKEVRENIDKMLEKEQDVDLKKEIGDFWDRVYGKDRRCTRSINIHDFQSFARHFYELGFNEKSDAPKIKGWVARDKSGDLYFFHYDCKPHRTDGIFHSECSEDVFHIDNFLFPEVDWQTEPIEVELTIHKPCTTTKENK